MASIWGELKRRNVVKVAVAYAIVGWLLIEVSATVLPIFEAPDWIVQVFTFFVILGFPVALILSWAYEITPDGIKLERNVTAGQSITHVTGRKLDFAIIGALVLALGFVVYNYESGDGEVSGVLPNSVAVLPFENLSPDPDNAYYAAGIHDEILNQLTKLSALNVIARTSMRQYANTEKSIPEIARELNVETVMEGSVRYDTGGRIRITTQLNDGVTGVHIWSETYTRDFDDIFAIESDVAMNVANALEAEFSLAEQASIEKVPTNSAEAYSLYLRSLATLGLPDIQYLDQATAVDPDFALAYAMKAYSLAYDTGAFDAPDFATVRENANRALRLDPTLGLADAALAFLHMGNRRWAEAEQAFQQALRRSPNEPEVLMMYSRFNRYRGEYAEGVRLARRAVELDPHNPLFQFQLATAYRYAQNDNAAVSALRIALDLSPAYASAHAQLAYAEISRGNVAEALRELQIAEQLFGENVPDWRIAQMADGYAQLGRREDVMRLFGELEERDRQSPVREAVWAKAYIARGDYQEALQRLEAAIKDPAPSPSDTLPLGQIKANIHSDPVLDEPRFLELRDRIGT